MNGWRIVLSIVGLVLLLAGFVIGSQQAQLHAEQRFVSMDQYIRDIAELKGDVKQLLRFHLEEQKRRP